MEQNTTTTEVDPRLVARIVASYVRHHQIGPDELLRLIVGVHRALAGLGHVMPRIEQPRRPAVPIPRSVQRDYVVCLECGFRARTLRRHLRARHGVEVAQYRARWNLAVDHPVTAPAYSNNRSAMARRIGLGRLPQVVAADMPQGPAPFGRPRRPGTK